MIVIKSFDTG